MLSKQELVFPYVVDMMVPGFQRHVSPGCYCQLPTPTPVGDLFAAFVSRVEAAIGERYLPVCRMSDGEFLFLFGPQVMPASIRNRIPLRSSIWYAKQLISSYTTGFKASTAPGVTSGIYTNEEVRALRERAFRDYAEIANHGILALHLEFGTVPFQENYFRPIRRWLDSGGIELGANNYVPFYFVYALLRGPTRVRILKGRRVLVVHSARDWKQKRIREALAHEGVTDIQWLLLSESRSYLDRLDLTTVTGQVDVCLIGAGVGKSHIMAQLTSLKTVCLDAGYCFEVWADPELRWRRPFMVDDSDYSEVPPESTK